jgi:hypothetical protein
VCKDIWPPWDFLAQNRADEGMRPISHNGGAFFQAKIVSIFAGWTANIFVEYEHEILRKQYRSRARILESEPNLFSV